MKRYTAIIFLFLSLNSIFSQTPVESQVGSWFTLYGNYKVSNKFSVSHLVCAWDYELADNFNFILYTFASNYQVSPKITTSIAYSYADIDSGFETNAPHTFENRLHQQLVYKHKLFNLPIDHRFRVEQRFLNKTVQNVLHNRLRYRFGTKINLNKSLFLRIQDEYIATVKTKKNDGFSENRLYGALGIHILKSANVQVGYLYRRIKGLDLHRLQLGLFYNVDLRKKKR